MTMKVVYRGKSNGVEPNYIKCPECKEQFVWKKGCNSYEIMDLKGGTLTYCLECSNNQDPDKTREQINKIWPPVI